jgi:hypothetical protein
VPVQDPLQQRVLGGKFPKKVWAGVETLARF